MQFVIVVTDGLSDVGRAYDSTTSATYSYSALAPNGLPSFPSGNNAGKLTGPIDPALCDSLKTRGVKIGVLHVPYLPNPGDYNYDWLVAQNAPPDAMATNLKACASSPQLYALVSDPNGLQAGLQDLYQRFSDVAHLTR